MSCSGVGIRSLPSDLARPSARPVLLLDFDGTICLGDGPVLAYAEAAFAALPAAQRAAAEEQLARFVDHDPQLHRQYADGYVLVQTLAASLPPAQLQAAYLTSRHRLAADGLGVRPAAGLAELLIKVGPTVSTVVLTNAPEVGVVETLERFGLSGLLDQVIVAGGKPTRMPEHLDVLLAGRPPSTLLSIGDHWINDVRIPLQRGTFGGLITETPRADQPAHLIGSGLAELSDGITEWAADPRAFARRHRLPVSAAIRTGAG
ncbi:HAD family hydrolase [Microlunatus soli]|uniref:HAD family hydrolase n=1 Tax=Microlunatus soli TaxID=630515 RepID=UPI0012F78341|nr:hypothetical protein [Microlunatus soli]